MPCKNREKKDNVPLEPRRLPCSGLVAMAGTRAVADPARKAGAIVTFLLKHLKPPHRWRLSGPPVISTRLLGLVQARLGDLEESGRRALEIVAFGEPVETAFVDGITGTRSLEALECRGMEVSTLVGRRLWLRLARPLYGAEGTGVRRREDALRFATWRLDGAERSGTTSCSLGLRPPTTGGIWHFPSAWQPPRPMRAAGLVRP